VFSFHCEAVGTNKKGGGGRKGKTGRRKKDHGSPKGSQKGRSTSRSKEKKKVQTVGFLPPKPTKKKEGREKKGRRTTVLLENQRKGEVRKKSPLTVSVVL